MVIHIDLNTLQQSLLDDLRPYEDVHERLAAVVERTRRIPRFSADARTADHRVPGCSSHVWLIGEYLEGRCGFRSDADSPVVRGLVALLADFYSGSTPREILATDTDPLEVLGLNRTLTHTRRHGLAAVVSFIRRFAEAHLTSTHSV